MRALFLSLLLCAHLSYAEAPAKKPTPKIETSTDLTVVGPIHFGQDSDVIEPGAAAALTLLAQIINEQAHIKTFEIAGHADPSTERRGAKKLSTRRAKAARAYLISQGVDPKRLLARGYADQQPLNAGASSTESSANRRVELRIVAAK